MSEEQQRIEVQEYLTEVFGLLPHPDKTDFVNHLALRINGLILNDFNGLVNLLYRLDIDEEQLREMLSKYPHDDAGYIIAQLIIDREIRKFETRKSFKKDPGIPEDDRW